MRKLFVAAATVAIFALLVTPAFADKGGCGGKGGGGSAVVAGSTIDLCTVDGVAVNGCASDEFSAASTLIPHLRGIVGFASDAQASPAGNIR